MGGGVVMSDYYAQRTTLNNGKAPRATFNPDNENKTAAECNANPNACPLDGGASSTEVNSYGEAGRPEPESQTNPFINLGVGQRFHFWKRMSIRAEFRNMLLLGTPDGFENYFAIWGGLGMRF